MTGTRTKIFKLILIGAFLTSGRFVFAEEVVTPKSAFEFLDENITEKGWKDYVGEGNYVICGAKKCNLDKQVCMSKTEKSQFDVWASVKNYIDAGYDNRKNYLLGYFDGTGLVGGIAKEARQNGYTKLEYVRYICVEESEKASYQQAGYTQTDEGGLNKKLEISSKTGKVIKEQNEKLKECYTAQSSDKKQKRYCLEISGNTVKVFSARSTKKVCEVIPVKLYQHQRCAFCYFMGGIFSAADKLTVISYMKLASSFAILIVVGLAIWIAMKTLVFVSSMTKQDAAKYITEMLKQSYKFMIAFFLLMQYGNVFEYIITPLLNAGLDFGMAFVDFKLPIPRETFFGGELSAETTHTLEDLKNLGSALPDDYFANVGNTYFEFPMYAKLEHFAHSVNLNFALIQTVGSTLICIGGRYMLPGYGLEVSPGLGISSVIYGICFCVIGFLLSLAFIFYMLDAIVQLGIVGALLPFLIASWPFKITSKWTQTGFKLFLNSVFTFMMMGLMARVIVLLIDSAVAFNNKSEDGGLAELVEALDGLDTERLKGMVNVLSLGFCLFVFTNMVGFLMMNKVSAMVDRFSSGGMKNISSQIATMGASTVVGATKKVAKPFRDRIEEKTEEAGKKLVRGTIGLLRSGPNMLRNSLSQRGQTNQTQQGGQAQASSVGQVGRRFGRRPRSGA